MQSALGQGTQFILQLPLSEAPQAEATPSAKKVLINAYNLCVLVIDDEKNVRTSLCMLLEELGCTCLQANSTAQAAQQVADIRPDLVLADFRLSGTDSGLLGIAAVQ